MAPDRASDCKTLNVDQLTRFWITFDYGSSEADQLPEWAEQIGFGVTSTDFDDAMSIVEREWFGRHGLRVPPVRDVVEDVDVSALSDSVREHSNPPNWRGMWFPRAEPLR